MNQRNLNFFNKKRKWSETKDAILGCYLRPYLSKIFWKSNPVCYVDCFAGKGKFDDGLVGSPLIALDCISKTVEKANKSNHVSVYFIELNFADDLNKNIKEYLASNQINCLSTNVISGKFEDNIDKILSEHRIDSIFLYVDPYGIKAIDIEKFNSFYFAYSKSIEILINFNTWGFFREACRIFKANFEFDPSLNEFLIEYNEDENLDIDELNRIAGGDYWIEIVDKYKKGEISSIDAEKELSIGIKRAFLRKYKYVLNVPVMSSDNATVPKYRLFHLTNHCEGCILMAETMYKKISEATISNRNNQLSIFNFSTEGVITDNDSLKSVLLAHITFENTHLNRIISDFYVKEGVVCSRPNISKLLNELFAEGKIEIVRNPAFTESTHKPATFMFEDKKHNILIKRR